MPCALSLPLIRVRLTGCLLVSALLSPTVSLPTIAAEETGTPAAPPITEDARSVPPADAPLPPSDRLPPTPGQPFSPPSHLSGASLLFVIWLVAEQVSADLGDRAEPAGLGQATP